MSARVILILLAVVLLSTVGSAQQATTKTDNYLLTTNPPGATAYFYGDYDLVVNTPANIPANFTGKYKVKIFHPGYESWKGELAFLPGSVNSVNIDLSRKTRVKAGLRSLFIPGWGQHYSGNTFRGAAFTIGAGSVIGILLYADRRYQDRKSSYNSAYQDYINATSIDDRNRLKPISDAARLSASRAETDRKRVFYAAAGFWVYNILDSMLFFPNGAAYYPVVSAIDEGGAEVSLVVKF